MKLSRYNQITELSDGQFAIYNILSGAFDICNKDVADAASGKGPVPEAFRETLFERGYIFRNGRDEQNYVDRRYQEFLSEQAKNENQYLFVFDYSCNFQCPYCYQKGTPISLSSDDDLVMDAFIDFVRKDSQKNGKRPFVTLFGGEPLLVSTKRKDQVSRLVKKLAAENIELTVVTNGYHFLEYLPILQMAKLREIHFTLDGYKDIHDKRRDVKEGTGSFDRIIKGMHAAVEAGITVNLRIITDKSTMPTFPQLATRLQEEGFLDLPKNKFKTSLGRNYELINDSETPEVLYTLDVMYADYAKLMVDNPLVKKMHMPSFFGITMMMETGEMYLPSFDTCPGAKSEFVLDLSGHIYSCTATCGREDYQLGTFYPEVRYNEAELEKWKQRSILTIPGCKDCSVGVVCGGGCAVIAKEQNGDILSKNCKPIKKVMDIGIEYFKNELLKKI